MSEKVKFYRGNVWDRDAQNEAAKQDTGEIVFVNDAFNMSTDAEGYKVARDFGSIYQDDKIVGTTKANELRLTEDLSINGGPLADAAKKAYVDGKIPAGTTLTEILTALFLQELYPNEATKPSIDISGEKSFGLKEVGSSVDIPSVSMTKDDGKFNASYSEPTQPSTSVTWSSESMTASITGFTGASISAGTTGLSSTTGTIVEGTNKVAYTATADYSAPANKPLTNLGNVAEDAKYTFIAKTGESKTADTTATGVYAIYSNGVELKNTNTNDDAVFGSSEINKMSTLIDYISGATKYIGFGGGSTKDWYVYLPQGVTIKSAKGYNPNTSKFDIDYTFTKSTETQTITTTYAGDVVYDVYINNKKEAPNNIKLEIKK